MTTAYGTLLRQFETEHFGAAMLKTQNSRICVHYNAPVTIPAKKCHETKILQ
jgi:hypothetical protein